MDEEMHPRSNGTKGIFGDALRVARRLPEQAQRGMRDRPEATLAIVAGASFAVGTIVGSRMLRTIAFAVLPVLAAQLLRDAPSETLRRLIERFLRKAAALGTTDVGTPNN